VFTHPPGPLCMLTPRLTVQAIYAIQTTETVEPQVTDHAGDHVQVDRTPERPGERVEADLRHRIASGEWQASEMMPTVAALAEHYQVSPGVVHRVLRRLADEGLVRIVARWGTFRA
jgi:Bacterial regulatory proteins, gntR family